MCSHALDLRAYASCMRTHTCMGIHVHARVLEAIKDKFSAFKTWFETNLTSFVSYSNLAFSDYKNHTWYLFKTRRKF